MAHATIWTLKTAGICNAENGITNNPSESNCISFRSGSMHVSIHQCMSNQSEIITIKREPSLMPFLHGFWIQVFSVDKVQHDLTNNKVDSTEKKPLSSINISVDGQIGLAQLAIRE